MAQNTNTLARFASLKMLSERNWLLIIVLCFLDTTPLLATITASLKLDLPTVPPWKSIEIASRRLEKLLPFFQKLEKGTKFQVAINTSLY